MKNMFLKLGYFIRKNAFFVVLALSVLAIGIITVFATTGNNKGEKFNYGNVENLTPTVLPGEDTETGVIEAQSFILPVASGDIGMDFAIDKVLYNETLDVYTGHMGIDFKTESETAVLAVCKGVVESVTYDILEGTAITISHDNGIKTVYKSLSPEIEVNVGDRVMQGDTIGVTSLSAYGEYKEGYHVHFEMLKDGEVVSPYDYLQINEK